MPSLKKYNISGEQIGEIALDDQSLKTGVCPQMIKDYIVAIRANARQWSANTKGRSEVNKTGRKPHAQKGTGNARQGCFAAPQYKGGGRVHGPKPKFDQHVRINKKERRAAISFLVSEKIINDKLVVLENTSIETPKTKLIAQFLAKGNFNDRRIIFVGEDPFDAQNEDQYATLMLSMRNIPDMNFKRVFNLSGYDLALNGLIVVMESAVDELKQLLTTN